MIIDFGRSITMISKNHWMHSKHPHFVFPAQVCELKPSSIDIEDFKVFLFFTLLIPDNMEAGLPCIDT